MATKTKLLATKQNDGKQIDELVNAFISETEDIKVRNIAYQAVGTETTTHYAFVTYEVKDASEIRKVGF